MDWYSVLMQDIVGGRCSKIVLNEQREPREHEQYC